MAWRDFYNTYKYKSACVQDKRYSLEQAIELNGEKSESNCSYILSDCFSSKYLTTRVFVYEG
jgi:hypothetical protein